MQTNSIDQSRQHDKPSAFMRLVALGRPYLGTYILLCLLSLTVSLGNTLIAEVLRRMVNAAFRREVPVLTQSMVMGLILVMCLALAQFGLDVLSNVIDLKSVQSLQERLLNKVMVIPMQKLKDYHSGDLLNRVQDSANVAQSALNKQGVSLFRNGLQAVMVLAYLLYLSVPLALGALVIAVVLPLAMAPFSKRIGEQYGQRQESLAAEQAFVQESVQGLEVVKGLSLWPTIQRLYLGKSDHRLARHRKVLVGESILWRVQMLVFVIGLLYALGYGGYLVVEQRLDIGAIAGFLIAFQNLLGPIGELSSQWPQFQNAIAQSQRVFELMDLPEEEGDAAIPSPTQKRNAHSLGEFRDITFSNVSFDYQTGQPVLRDLSLTLKAGTTTALVGPSGGGKSTLMQLLLRFLSPVDGDIRFGEDSISTFSPKDWRRLIGYVPQETLIFSGTLYDNIVCGATDAGLEDVLRAAKMARVLDFALRLPNGLDTTIGEKGILLSGGERQRLALARAILRDPPILLLDEPTSALDSESESLVQTAIRESMQNRTTLVVAHRLSTIAYADQIAFVDKGRIVERGQHRELIAAQGAYYRLHSASELQTDGVERRTETWPL